MKNLVTAALVVGIAGLIGVARADDKANPTGTWKWAFERGGQTINLTLKLKLDGDKLTGTMSRGEDESKIEDGKFKDGEVTFTVSREVNGNKLTVKYSGKVTGDTIKGKSEIDRDGQTIKRNWDAKRSKE